MRRMSYITIVRAKGYTRKGFEVELSRFKLIRDRKSWIEARACRPSHEVGTPKKARRRLPKAQIIILQHFVRLHLVKLEGHHKLPQKRLSFSFRRFNHPNTRPRQICISKGHRKEYGEDDL